MLISGILWTGATLFVMGELVRFTFSSTEPDEPDELDKPDPDAPPHELFDEDEGEASSRVETSLVLSAASFGLSLAGPVFPLAQLLSAPVLLVSMGPTAARAGVVTLRERRVDFAGLTVLGTALELGLGLYRFASFSWLLFVWGERLQQHARNRVLTQLEDALQRVKEHAWVLREGVELELPLEQIGREDLVIVRSGDFVPVDGYITEGSVVVDEQIIMGTPSLSERGPGDSLLATAQIIDGSALMRPSRTGAETVARRLAQLRALSSSYEQRLDARAEQEGDRSVPATLGLMALGMLQDGPVGMLSGYWVNSIELSWLGAPSSTMNTIEAAAQRAILIKDGRSLELLAEVDTLVLSKTGMLESFRVDQLHAGAAYEPAEILRLSAALGSCVREQAIAQAILREALRTGTPVSEAEECTQLLGVGLRGIAEGCALLLGGTELFEREGLSEQLELPEVRALIARAAQRGASLVHLAVRGRWAGALEFLSESRPGLESVLDKLRMQGLELIMLDDKSELSATSLAERLGVSRVEARPLPEQRQALIRELQAQGRCVCLVGSSAADGLALRSANVSIALAGASPIASHCAQIILQEGTFRQVEELFSLREDFAIDQLIIVSVARGTTLVSALAFLVSPAWTSLGWMLGLYAIGASVVILVAESPRFRLGGSRDGAVH